MKQQREQGKVLEFSFYQDFLFIFYAVTCIQSEKDKGMKRCRC